MADKKFPQSGLPIRKTVELLPTVFRSDANDKFMSAVVDPLVQPGTLQKLVGYVGRRYGNTYNGSDIYIDTDNTLRSRYQLEPGVVSRTNNTVDSFYDYLDFKNQLQFFGNTEERDDLITGQEHYSWNPPIDWDKFINYREYYWEPSGPPAIPVFGQSAKIISTYKVALGLNSFIFTPDSFTNNPTITLYRGQSYKFQIKAPKEGFAIRTNYDTGSLIFNPARPYSANEQAVYDGKLWKAKVAIASGASSSITLGSQDWEFIALVASGTALDYSIGVTNNGIENGTLTFKVPYDAPDVLFYQSLIDPNKFGRFLITDIEANTKINIDKDIIGKITYTSSNGITFSNGMVLEFRGQVTPLKYSLDSWLVEGVGTAITLTRFADLIVPVLTTDTPEVVFDNEGFDTQPFDDATTYPAQKDYITIKRDSKDTNPWSRYNRWFHRNVLEYSYTLRGEDFSATESQRAKRPIIEFKSNIQLFNHGSISKEVVDYIDDYTTDVFSKIEGSVGYNIDGENLFEGARILVTADTDILANNKIYEVNFITHNNKKRIHLAETTDSDSVAGAGVLVRRGKNNGGLMYYFNGSSWLASQAKTAVNQPPLFDVFDSNGISFSNTDTYPINSFNGNKLFAYKIGNSIADKELGFSLSYLNIDNVGDIQFDWNWEIDNFTYTLDQLELTKNISSGYFKINPDDVYLNGWTKTDNTYIQPIIDSQVITEVTNTIKLTTINWDNVTDNTNLIINFYVNQQQKQVTPITRERGVFTFANNFAVDDVVYVKIITDLSPDTGYYEMPVSLEKNPLNQALTTFTLGQAIDHVAGSVEFDTRYSGNIPGISNIRDLDDYQPFAKRFLKHSGIAPLAVSLLCDKTSNIIKSIQHARKSYTDFKNNFIARSTTIDYNDNLINFVDDIITDLTKTKNADSAFSNSDMIGSGAFIAINYTVEDTGITTFALSEKFTLTELSNRAVYVYINNQQLLNATEYEFNATFGFITILADLAENDEVEIREYISTAANYIPSTPTSMGLYKKYTPMKFVDDTYQEPREVIQGHDGSITASYGDFRDDLLLELEYRIYNNIKQEYNTAIFDNDLVVGGYYSNVLYTKSQLDGIVVQEFLKWVQNTNINYTINEYFDSENSFTYTYSNMTDPSGTQNLPGYWRGVYQWFFDTDRPHRCPWEMLGFSEQPVWWEAEYGSAPYTSGNLILWEDLEAGIIRKGTTAGTYDRYKRPGLTTYIPVDSDGNLLSPLDAGVSKNFTLINNRGSFVLGDVSPAEYAWRSSSEWPFAVTLAMCLMKPFEFITDSFDRSNTTTNILGQTINSKTGVFSTLKDIVISTASNELTSGLVKYVSSYIRSIGADISEVNTKLRNLDVNLSTRLSGFVDKAQQKYILDSKNPSATSSNIYIPAENYDIIFNVSSPIASVSYSGVILEKSEGGWVISGYDNIHPYFNYYPAVANQADPTISVGGVSETFTDWTTNKTYNNGQIVRRNNTFYRALRTHSSSTVFDTAQWKKLPQLPLVGAVEAQRRRTFNTLNLSRLSYGARLDTVQEVVNFLLGYEAYLKSVGFTFNRYDPANQVSQDWTTSCKEYMFWTRQNWAVGSLITLSPGAEKLDITIPVGVADNILDGFYSYQLLKADGKPLAPNFINVNRSFQNITVATTNTTEGIHYLTVYYVLKEHVAIFSDRTVFNDIIYDKSTGYRQDRLKTQGFRTVDWDGDYTSPGFLFDNVNITAWAPFNDYKLGDIVSYRSYNWTSLVNQLGSETFNNTSWTKLDSTPEKQLVANFDYKINQFEDYYNVDAEGTGESQRALARHAVGYQTREYLQTLAEDPVTQFQLYQGFVREKGTANAISKVFNKLSRSTGDSIVLNEEWAFRVGRVGGTDQLREIEFEFSKNKFKIDPQPFLLTANIDTAITDQYYRIAQSNFTVSPIDFTFNVTPVAYSNGLEKTAGYVKNDQIDFILKSRDDILDLDINSVVENDHIWITFDSYTWTVLRYNQAPQLNIIDVSLADGQVTITLSRRHSLIVDDIVGVKEIPNLTGFFKIVEVGDYTLVVEATSTTAPEFDASTLTTLYTLTTARTASYDTLDPEAAALLVNGAKLWVDNNGSDLWEVIRKNKQFVNKELTEYGITTPINAGTKVIYDDNLKQTISSIPGSGYVMSYIESHNGLTLKQIIAPLSGFESNVVGSFGSKMAISPDSRWLIVSSPLASGIKSNYQGGFSSASYIEDDIVLYAGSLWKANKDINTSDYSTIDLDSENWEQANSIPALSSGRAPGFTQQGMISIYEWSNQQWNIHSSFVSPRPQEYEFFGSEVAIGVSGTEYYMAVSAIGSLENRGRVYLFEYDGVEWTHKENSSYAGIYDPTGATSYPAGTIVWFNESLWQSLEDQLGDGSSITVDSQQWTQLDPGSTHTSLPSNISIDDDGSTLALINLTEEATIGILGNTQLAELIKVGDEFGTSMTMSRDGGILVIGAPNSDGQYFANYRGQWRADVEYAENDVVKSETQYYKLTDATSINDDPSGSGLPWINVGDSTTVSSGKVYIYQRSTLGTYDLKQTINAGSMVGLNDITTGNTEINAGDQFGFAIDVDYSGTTLVITSPRADLNLINQGSAYVFETAGLAALEFRLKQKLESFEQYADEWFGQSISISSGTERIAIGAKNTPFVNVTMFDTLDGTSFDQSLTRFIDAKGYAGAVYVFERKADSYFLTEKLEAELSPFESFGNSIDCTRSAIAVGSPRFVAPVLSGSAFTYPGQKIGTVRLFRKDETIESWEVLSTKQKIVDLAKIRSIGLYDNVKNTKIQDIDYVDHANLKILNSAEQELAFKTPFDPAVYTLGTDDQVVEPTQSWTTKHVGELWWDLSQAKWIDYQQGDIAYRVGNWNTLAAGASIDIYEWVESLLLPSEWSGVADTNEGIAEGISGQPLYPNDNVYSVKELFNSNTGLATSTLYYYWVKSKVTVPENMPSRRISAASVASYISSPAGTGTAFVALLDTDKILTYNFTSVISSDTALLNIEYRKTTDSLNAIHNEYQLLTEGVADSVPTKQLETKWIDSLIGINLTGDRVPDSTLSDKQKYGISFRPRQSMFVNNIAALKAAIQRVNTVLQQESFADIINFNNLNLIDQAPNAVLNRYDVAVDTYADLLLVGTAKTRQATLSVNIVDGLIDTIDIVSPGFGYKPTELVNQSIPGVYVGPTISITGTGTGATAACRIDGQGRVIAVVITSKGKKYSSASATVRQFSVLVNSDATSNNFWSIYAWDDVRKVFFRSISQSYDTTRYWSLSDWWKEGYTPTDRIVKEITNLSEYPAITNLEAGDLVRIKEYGAGGWAVFEELTNLQNTSINTFLDNHQLVGREKGTVELSSSLYDITSSGIGYDTAQTFDATYYDIGNSTELRNIFAAIKENIFIGDYAIEWNRLFFNSVRYAFAEQTYIDWAFKTSFLTATHNVGPLTQKLNYKNDNIESFQEYINEVKPYRTTVREYISRYDTIEAAPSAISDFDLPPTYSVEAGKIVPVNQYSIELQSYPWKWWTDTNGYSITAITTYKSGADYISAPAVLITGTGTGATAQAYISNGAVSGIKVTNPGTGYTSAPTVTLVGGNPASSEQAKAVAFIGDSKVRTFDLTMKFDRISKTGLFTTFSQSQTLVGTGNVSVFNLNYAPTRDKSKISVVKNGQVLLNNQYFISLFTSTTDTYSLLKGKISFAEIPARGDSIVVNYEKNDSLLDSVNRIQKYYAPTAGMKGNELTQLMTGIDFGGVQIQGTTFDVTGGWDALPWFTDNWDSVESSADYYVVCDGSTVNITLPFVPATGQEINIYIKRVGDQRSIRIDDPAFNNQVDSSTSSNPNAEMPTFIGDGVTATVDFVNQLTDFPYVETAAGDILIFRPIESDGSVSINDGNLLDTNLSGGTLASMTGAYSTATGITADEISIDGDKFISPDQVPATEENVPGQVLDSVSIKVFNNTSTGAAPLQSKTIIADGTTKLYTIDLNVLETTSVLVYVNKINQEDSYTIDFVSNQIEFIVAPTAESIIEIISVGIGGIVLLDYQEFVADGETSLFLTAANFADTSSVFVTINGQREDIGFTNSSALTSTTNKTLIQFGTNPEFRDVVKIICLGSSTVTDSSGVSLVQVHKQSFEFEGSTRNFDLAEFVNLPSASAASSMIVEVNGVALRGPDTSYYVYDGITNKFVLGLDPVESAGAILTSNIKLFVNNVERTVIRDYVYDGTNKIITITPAILSNGNTIRIENNLRSEYYVENNNIVIAAGVELTSTNETDNDIIDVTWFSEYPTMRIISDEFTGGKVNYFLQRTPLSINYVWVYKNGIRLTKDIDYFITLPRGSIYLTDNSTTNDLIKVVMFGTDIYKLPSAYEIHKDMLNIYRFTRYSINSVTLAVALNYYDQTITVTDATELTAPIASRNIPGVVEINGERIEYTRKAGNVLSQLRRGSHGTSIGNLYAIGTPVVDQGSREVIPYNESQIREDFISDGNTILIGPLNYVPAKSSRNNWVRTTIPTTYGPCDEIEVFVGGRRLRKDPLAVYNEINGASSPGADITLEAEFSVDGSAVIIRLTEAVSAGTRISIIKRTGNSWYDRGEDTATSGITLLENATPIANFIAKRTTKLPE
jgi:hypothetical protein